MTIIQKMDDAEKSGADQDLILTLNLHEEVIQFNKESERLTGYIRDQVLHKNFCEIFVPEESFEQWKGLLDSIKQAIWIDNCILPLKTRNNETHLISWTGFLVKDENGSGKNICIFGKPLKKIGTPVQPSQMPSPSITPLESEKKAKSTATAPPVHIQELPKNRAPDVTCLPSVDKSTPQPKLQTPQEIPSTASEKPSIPSQETVKTTPSIDQPAPEIKSAGQSKASPESSKNIPEKNNNEMIMKHRVKKIKFASKKASEQGRSDNSLQEQFLTPLASMGKLLETTSHKIDTMNEALLELSQKYEQVLDRVTELEKKDKRWHKKQKPQQQPEASPQLNIPQPSNEQKDQTPIDLISEGEQQEEEEFSFFSDPFGLKRQRKELLIRGQELETRSKQLDAVQHQLQKERTIFNARVEEFSKWREKLMLLESAIEKRRQELMRQEDRALTQKTVLPASGENLASNQQSLEKSEPSDSQYSNETLDKIPQSAAIIQRGILKQINSPFMELLGYPREELMEKSFFDFLALEGLADVEKYYLDRLKGDAVSMYTTVLSTKENTKVPVEVNIKQTIYNGEKAEIVIVTSLTA